jgi:hypothetical protein
MLLQVKNPAFLNQQTISSYKNQIHVSAAVYAHHQANLQNIKIKKQTAIKEVGFKSKPN